MYAKRISLFLIGILSLLLPLSASADATLDAATRIKERLPQIDQMKAEGVIGENAAGLIAPRKELGPRQNSLVEAENKDRLAIYQSVAQKTNQTVDAVGAQRAIRIAELARKGVWLQRLNGEWYQKP